MATEISCVFRLEPNDKIVKERNIGDGVCLQEIFGQDWWAELREKDILVAAKETLDWATIHTDCLCREPENVLRCELRTPSNEY